VPDESPKINGSDPEPSHDTSGKKHQAISIITKQLPDVNSIENLFAVWNIRVRAENDSNILVIATTGLGEVQKPALN
jgi:hypothetical protein